MANGDEEEQLAVLAQELEQRRRDAERLFATSPFPKQAMEILEHVNSLTPQLLREQGMRQAVETQQDIERKRRRRLDDFFVARGERYRDCSLVNYHLAFDQQRSVHAALSGYADNLSSNVSTGKGIVLFGPSGTGKDHLLVGLTHLAIIEHGLSVSWRNGQDLFGDWRDAIDRKCSEISIVREFLKPDVLYLSDPMPQSGSLTDHQANMLFRVIDGRYSRCRATWVTLNAAKRPEACERVGASIVDRLTEEALALHCDWPSHRRPSNDLPNYD